MYDVLIIIRAVQQVEHIADGPFSTFLCIQTIARPTSDVAYATDVVLNESYECRPTEAGCYQNLRLDKHQVRDCIVRLESYCIYYSPPPTGGVPPAGAVGGVAPVVPGTPPNPPRSAPGTIPAAKSVPVVISCSNPAGVIPIERKSCP